MSSKGGQSFKKERVLPERSGTHCICGIWQEHSHLWWRAFFVETRIQRAEEWQGSQEAEIRVDWLFISGLWRSRNSNKGKTVLLDKFLKVYLKKIHIRWEQSRFCLKGKFLSEDQDLAVHSPFPSAFPFSAHILIIWNIILMCLRHFW